MLLNEAAGSSLLWLSVHDFFQNIFQNFSEFFQNEKLAASIQHDLEGRLQQDL